MTEFNCNGIGGYLKGHATILASRDPRPLPRRCECDWRLIWRDFQTGHPITGGTLKIGPLNGDDPGLSGCIGERNMKTLKSLVLAGISSLLPARIFHEIQANLAQIARA